ncbi:hypothetical protein GQ53DRAFT_187483 [Thozetella sp. PMI_491]|nr:hypothetical protein GQ53DRAFT_187483 [Thozetella sp. PMI_491]
MCSQLFVETETPAALFKGKASRGGYGDMTVWRQRFFRWNLFFLMRVYINTIYLLFAWRLGWREIVTKLFAFGEIYDALIFLSTPFLMPPMLLSSWRLTMIATGILEALNAFAAAFFNAWHLSGKHRHEGVRWAAVAVHVDMKLILTLMNVVSVYWVIYQYPVFFSKHHGRVTQNVAAWEECGRSRKQGCTRWRSS